MGDWQGTSGALAQIVREQSRKCLETYAADPNRVKEDFRNERRTAESGYAIKQVHELVQNAADAMVGSPGRIEVVLSRDALYVANEGKPFDRAGVEAVMAAHLSGKGEDEIGRFGLGFKSVVVVSDVPSVFSRSGSFQFDQDWSTAEISRIVPNAEGYPLLRLARPVDPILHAEVDAQLAGLMEWATTVVRVPLVADRERLSADLDKFPAHFLLFSPHVESLTLRDVVKDKLLRHSLMPVSGRETVLVSGVQRERWAVARRKCRLTRAQSNDIGAMKKGDEVVVQLAVPLDGAGLGRPGSLWAYFPTDDRTSLRAIINAPWKLSPDRTRLQAGAYNGELLENAVPQLFAELVPALHDPSRPAHVLTAYPGRYSSREMLNWADDIINKSVSERLKKMPSLPDCEGRLRVPETVRIHPDLVCSDKGTAALAAWRRKTPSPRGWLHPDAAVDKNLRAKALRLAGPAQTATVREWLEALVEDGSVTGSAVAIEAYAALGAARDTETGSARILLEEDGTPYPVRPGKIFVRTSPAASKHAFVHPGLVALPGLLSILRSLGIAALDKAGELRALLSGADPARLEWKLVWSNARGCAPDVAYEILKRELPGPLAMSVRVRNAVGDFVPLIRTLLPGAVLNQAGDRADARFMIDIGYHASDQELLGRLGAVAAPRLADPVLVEPWLDGYIDKIRDRYARQVNKPALNRERITVKVPQVPVPLQMYKELSFAGRLAMTRHLLGLVDAAPWSAAHPDFGEIPTNNPVADLIRQFGMVDTTVGPFSLALALGAGGDADREVMPVADLPATASWLKLPTSRADLREEAWSALFSGSRNWDVARRERLYAWGAEVGVLAPDRLTVRHGNKVADVPRADVAVVMDDEDARSLLDQQFAVLQVREEIDRDNLIDVWGLEDGRQLLDQNFTFEAVGPVEPLGDLFPALIKLRPEAGAWTIQVCSSMALEVLTHGGMRSRSIRRRAEDGTIYTVATDPRDILRAVSDLIFLDDALSDDDIDDVLSAKRDAALQQRIDRVFAVGTVEEKLYELFGEEILRRHVPALALAYIEDRGAGAVTGAELGRVFMSVHGVAALRALKSQLTEFDPPKNWVGGSRARQFVAMFGFPPEFAGVPGGRRDAFFSVAGPTTLPPAHDYQAKTIEAIRRLLGGDGPARGMVGLPTGAGKTRVAVEAIVGHMSARDDSMTVLWIAQTDELCEQAVETWSYIWRAIGPDAELSIGRLWASNLVEELTGMAVVVATPSTLRNCVTKESYAWLRGADLVVTDEAHHAIAPEYTKVFEWLGRDFTNVDDATRPMIGLSATPFRGFNVKEGAALARRYASHRLDDGVFGGEEPHRFLQSRGVLAKVSHEVLAGVDVEMTANERTYVKEFRSLHPDVEARLGEDSERNRRIIESIESLPKDWTAILFAASVAHAQVLASLLTYRGVPSVAISGETDRSVRRNVIAEFKAGRVRVITNYGVLAQGFDAPAVQAVYITRPTFSPNLYQQMIGRGLRGPANGGSDDVLIVNVEDNFNQFGEQLSFHEFDYLWDG